MSETIGNAITDDKNTVRLVTEDTFAVIDGGNKTEGLLNTGAFFSQSSSNHVMMMSLYKENGKLYAIKLYSAFDMDSINIESKEIALPTA